MTFTALLAISLGLSMDAFAVSITSGCSIRNKRRFYFILTALSFGLFQAGMPVLGWYLGSLLHVFVEKWSAWISFVLLLAIGLKMIHEGWEARKGGSCEDPDQYEFCFKKLLFLSIATSIDAFLVGISFFLLGYSLWLPVLIIGLVTFVMSLIGLFAGKLLQVLFQEAADFLGGGILVIMAFYLLFQHL